MDHWSLFYVLADTSTLIEEAAEENITSVAPKYARVFVKYDDLSTMVHPLDKSFH